MEVTFLLNEIGEYEQYTLPPENFVACPQFRLKYMTLIKREFSGLERALTIVARHFLFDETERRDEKAVCEILKAWCGFKNEATALPVHFNGWLPNYICRAFLAERLNSCSEKISDLDLELQASLTELIKNTPVRYDFEKIRDSVEAWENFKATRGDALKKIGNEPTQILALLKALVKLSQKNKQFSKSVFGSLTAKDDIPFRAITYGRIIANALLAGKLRRYYLVCDEEMFQTKKILKGTKKLLSSDRDMILKMMAEYLLQRRNTTQLFVETNDSNMVNWLAGSRKAENFDCESYVLAESDEKIFEVIKINLGGINAIKINLNSEWTRHFRLVEDGSDEDFGRIFFSDSSFAEPLAEGVKYND